MRSQKNLTFGQACRLFVECARISVSKEYKSFSFGKMLKKFKFFIKLTSISFLREYKKIEDSCFTLIVFLRFLFHGKNMKKFQRFLFYDKHKIILKISVLRLLKFIESFMLNWSVWPRFFHFPLLSCRSFGVPDVSLLWVSIIKQKGEKQIRMSDFN